MIISFRHIYCNKTYHEGNIVYTNSRIAKYKCGNNSDNPQISVTCIAYIFNVLFGSGVACITMTNTPLTPDQWMSILTPLS